MPFPCRIHPILAAFLLLLPAGSRLPAQQTQPYNFQPVTIIAGGYVPDLVAHPTAPGVIYARTDIGSVYRWNASKRPGRRSPISTPPASTILTTRRALPSIRTTPIASTSSPVCASTRTVAHSSSPTTGAQPSRRTTLRLRCAPTATVVPPANASPSTRSSQTSC